MQKKTLILTFVTLAVILVIINSDAYAQCSMCRATATSSIEAGQNVGKGLNSGILYLMTIPYLILLILFYFFFRKQIKAKLAGLKRK